MSRQQLLRCPQCRVAFLPTLYSQEQMANSAITTLNVKGTHSFSLMANHKGVVGCDLRVIGNYLKTLTIAVLKARQQSLNIRPVSLHLILPRSQREYCGRRIEVFGDRLFIAHS
jgi:hypothetical protein